MSDDRIAITGANGRIGTVLRRGLADYAITALDLPGTDCRDIEALRAPFPGHRAVIHLAWQMQDGGLYDDAVNLDNIATTANVYQAALEAGVRRVIMASSVHADQFTGQPAGGLLSPDAVPTPDSPYGAAKVFMEALGRYYARRGLEVICVRFGRVRLDDDPGLEDPWERIVWLSHRDAQALIRACLAAPSVPGGFAVVYGVSDNTGRVQDVSNPFGWAPVDDFARLPAWQTRDG
jgi:uronate dehydrogenase